MGSTRAEFLDDKVRVHYNLSKPDGLADEEGSIDIPYGSVPGLRPVPKELLKCTYFSYCEEVFVPKADSTIIFVFCIWEEKSSDSHKESIHGPYLKAGTGAAAKTAGSAFNADTEASGGEKENEESEGGQPSKISPDSEAKPEQISGCGATVILLIAAAIVVLAYYALR